ncbi:hypothetical protein FA95DRAFT_1567911 [Auriscalpium vulgare]|uniref:Uncharacterized protein n=1 Tax=Auriscalpium vulgare TaxID=40419 RepID=A0ACB8R2S5_9AGAM|nr:hypothetical protein FA95DRAFT_1567911 [Auriscalpium vulgare]
MLTASIDAVALARDAGFDDRCTSYNKQSSAGSHWLLFASTTLSLVVPLIFRTAVRPVVRPQRG